jgi:peptidyl-prolyl cis-trans isomerase C
MDDMLAMKWIIKKSLLWLLLFTLLLTACAEPVETIAEEVASSTPATPTTAPTLEEPTATPQPAAAIVNGDRISLELFEQELERYLLAQEALGNENPDEAFARETVVNDLIDQMLLAQGAQEADAAFSDADVQARIDQLAEEVDLEAWMAAWGYTREGLLESLRFQVLAANQRDRIAAAIPETVEQVELRQIFAFTEAGARRALANLNAGTPFEEVAFEFSPDTGGYLGWVPRGYLLIPVVEEAVFDQPVGSYTEIIESEIGYHIVLVLSREVRPLTSDARLTLARQALYAWLENRRSASVIEVLID